jgi:hypothetical protein
MFTAYVAVTVLVAAANLYAAGMDLVRHPKVAINMDRAGVPRAWMTPLGILKAVGGLGLLVGIWAPPIGVAAAVGLVLFFIGAIITHVRGRFYSFAYPVSFLSLAVAALALRLATL